MMSIFSGRNKKRLRTHIHLKLLVFFFLVKTQVSLFLLCFGVNDTFTLTFWRRKIVYKIDGILICPQHLGQAWMSTADT